MPKSRNRKNRSGSTEFISPKSNPPRRVQPSKQTTKSMLDVMVDGREFESLLQYDPDPSMDLAAEIRRAISEIESIRKKPLLCYMSNVVNANIKAPISIDNNDDLPFAEMISSIPEEVDEIDILLVTPGGSGQQVAKFVDRLRPRFKKVSFILPNIAMSAGTIFAMSGDELIMDSRAYIGPIDPQIPNKDGHFIPAQAILTLIDDIQKRGEQLLKNGKNPPWSDLQILRQIDGKEIGNAINASNYSVELVENFLYDYKFGAWNEHSDQRPVTPQEKRDRAKQIAELLCDHSLWKTHSRGISREAAWDKCKLKIIHPETISGLDRSIRRFWTLNYWLFENSPIFKIFISENYAIFRNDMSLINSIKH